MMFIVMFHEDPSNKWFKIMDGENMNVYKDMMIPCNMERQATNGG
jgi:hypothetical protein